MNDVTRILSSIEQDPPHRFSRGGEEVPAAVPVPDVLSVHQAEVRLVDQRRRLQRLPRLFMGQPLSRQLAQLFVDEWEQFGRGFAVTGLGGFEKAGYV